MTDGPQQPQDPPSSAYRAEEASSYGWNTPPAAPQQDGGQEVLRGQVHPSRPQQGGEQPQQQISAWTAPAEWRPPVPGQGTRGP